MLALTDTVRPLDLIIIAFAAVGCLVVMGLIALAVERYFAEKRERIRAWRRNWRALRAGDESAGLGYLPRRERNWRALHGGDESPGLGYLPRREGNQVIR